MADYPPHLQPATGEWFAGIVSRYDFEPHHLRLLQLAAESWDAVQKARVTIADVGQFYTDRFGAPRLHPAVNVERDARLSFARLIRELALDVEPPAESRPPRIGGVKH